MRIAGSKNRPSVPIPSKNVSQDIGVEILSHEFQAEAIPFKARAERRPVCSVPSSNTVSRHAANDIEISSGVHLISLDRDGRDEIVRTAAERHPILPVPPGNVR